MEGHRMNTLINVVRYQLLKKYTYLVLPWAWAAFGFALDLVIFAAIPITHSYHQVMTATGLVKVPNPPSPRDAGGLVGIIVVYFILGVVCIAQELPFGLTLGLSRRTYYAGTVLLAAALAVVNGLAITVLQALERATGGWGESAHVFQIPYVLDGPWYVTWLTATAALALLSVWGMWFGIVYRRWNLAGVLVFSGVQISVLLLAGLVITWSHAWSGTGHFLTVLPGARLAGLLVALTAVLMGGGYATIRRATV
jgi:hypothetical protein